MNWRARRWQAGLAESKGKHIYSLLMDRYSMKEGEGHLPR